MKTYRKQMGITIKQASEGAKVPMRTYIRYENDPDYGDELKRKAMLDAIRSNFEITENRGILKLSQIKDAVAEVLRKHEGNVDFCYLFGSYAKGYAGDESDVDLCVCTSLTGLAFVGLIEELRLALHKKVDLLRLSDISDNLDLLKEIMKDGIKIYG